MGLFDVVEEYIWSLNVKDMFSYIMHKFAGSRIQRDNILSQSQWKIYYKDRYLQAIQVLNGLCLSWAPI